MSGGGTVDYWTKIWATKYKERRGRLPPFDLWLDKYDAVLEASRDTPIIDLGCGMGNDSLYLSERGYRVVACDQSEFAVRCVSEAVPAAEVMVFDMLRGLPFIDGLAKIVIADLSLHYFSWSDTLAAVREINRVLIDGGHLLCRLNSTKDVAHGAGRGERVEDNYYDVNGHRKRFFDASQIERLFAGWKLQYCAEYLMNRYEQPKILWEVAAQKVRP